MLQYLDQLFYLHPDTLLTNTKFTSYKKYFFNVIPGNIDKQKLSRINTFLKTINQNELYALGQQMTKLNSRIRKLYKANEQITTAVIDNHKDIYDLCCSCIEKYLKIIYGIKQAYDGKILAYNDIKKKYTYSIKTELEKINSNYLLLLKPFITIIWNANKHTGTLKDPVKKRIEFRANEGKKTKSYSAFIQLTKELCTVTFLLSRYSQAIAFKIAKEAASRKVPK